jgi:hypothetical protein
MEVYRKLKLVSKRDLFTSQEQAVYFQSFSDLAIRTSLNFRPSQADSARIDCPIYYDFVDRYIIRHLRRPNVHLPNTMVEANMQNALQTPFQEYVYSLSKNCALPQIPWRRSFSAVQGSCSSLDIVTNFFGRNQDHIVFELLKLSNEHLFKKFYSLAWFYCSPNYASPPALKGQSCFTSDHAPLLLIHLINSVFSLF